MTAGPTRLDETPRDGPIPRYELDGWARDHGVVAGITGRGDGFNLGLLTTEPAALVTARWQRLFAAFRPGFACFAVGLQTHETRVAVHRDPPDGWHVLEAVDGHATRTAGVLLTVTVADCIPVYLVHPDTRTVGLLHAGWRGVAAGMLERGVSTMVELADAPAGDLVMHCGIGICGGCYQVGPEVWSAVGAAPSAGGGLDLRAVLCQRAHGLGITRVTGSGWCAAHDREHFFSHRRSGGRDGRMLAYLGVPRA